MTRDMGNRFDDTWEVEEVGISGHRRIFVTSEKPRFHRKLLAGIRRKTYSNFVVTPLNVNLQIFFFFIIFIIFSTALQSSMDTSSDSTKILQIQTNTKKRNRLKGFD